MCTLHPPVRFPAVLVSFRWPGCVFVIQGTDLVRLLHAFSSSDVSFFYLMRLQTPGVGSADHDSFQRLGIHQRPDGKGRTGILYLPVTVVG